MIKGRINTKIQTNAKNAKIKNLQTKTKIQINKQKTNNFSSVSNQTSSYSLVLKKNYNRLNNNNNRIIINSIPRFNFSSLLKLNNVNNNIINSITKPTSSILNNPFLFRQSNYSFSLKNINSTFLNSQNKVVSNEIKARNYSQQLPLIDADELKRLSVIRNIGISAHIDSGKTTLTERILFYTGRIGKMHEVKGKDGVGATMDSMELEREKGITIQSAATFCSWKQSHINIIDTPGHVDFTIEVERSLRVLDGAILVLCSVSGVQSQSITVDRQMKRYKVPRVVFINKCDRMGANPFKGIEQLRAKLGLNACAVQIPMGLEEHFGGVVDIIDKRACYFEGEDGVNVVYKEVPEKYVELMEEKRKELLERLAELDPHIEELFLADTEPSPKEIREAIRRQTIALKFCAVFMGSAYKNKGVQELLDGVVHFLPNPAEVDNFAMDRNKNEEKQMVVSDKKKPLIALAFKLEEGKYGQLTYMRVYQGTLQRSGNIVNTSNNRKLKVPRIVRTHAKELEDVNEIHAGEICAIFGVECASGDTFCEPGVNMGMESMFVPEPVVSLSVTTKDKSKDQAFSRAIGRFQREDPTFRVKNDQESGQTIISGMGELHLEIYIERMKREYECEVVTGRPYVAYRETIAKKTPFDYLHKKQSGGAGQYAKVVGYIEPLPFDHPTKFEFVNHIIGNVIPPNYITACEKGFVEACIKGPLLDCPVWGIRVVLTDGATHVVDSSELAFKIACGYALRQAFQKGSGSVIEPLMEVEIIIPSEFQGNIINGLNKRRALITNTQVETGDQMRIIAEVPLAEMFGYSTEIRSLTQGKGEFSMDYLKHERVPPGAQMEIIRKFNEEKEAKEKAKKK